MAGEKSVELMTDGRREKGRRFLEVGGGEGLGGLRGWGVGGFRGYMYTYL